MKHLYEGKTKSVYKLEDGNIKLIFKDDMTGENGIFDPGANTVGLTVAGSGKAGLSMSTYFFKLLESNGINTHFISSNLEENSMIVKPIEVFGKGLEVICRLVATGSFIRRYGNYIKDGTQLDFYVEMTLKDDIHGDPLITQDALTILNILNTDEYNILKYLTKKITKIIETTLKEKELTLYDIKLEFGKNSSGIILIDELSAGNMRVFKDNKPVEPIELSKYFI